MNSVNNQYQSLAHTAPVRSETRHTPRRHRAFEHGRNMGAASWFTLVLMIMTVRISLYIQGVVTPPLVLVRDMLAVTFFSMLVFTAVYVLSVDWHKRIVWWAELRAMRKGLPLPKPVVLPEHVNLARQMFRVGKTNMVLLPEGLALERLHRLIKANVEAGIKMKGDKLLSARALADMDVLPQSDFSKYNKFLVDYELVEAAGKTKNAGMMLTQKGQTCFRVNVE